MECEILEKELMNLDFEYANLKSLGLVASHDSLREETAVKREQKLSPMLISPQMLHM